MFQEERYEGITSILALEGRVKVKELALRFEVTDDCIRKDLRELEAKGLLSRVHGGAIAIRKHHAVKSVAERTKLNMEVKRRIAEKSAALIAERDIVFLDVSTTNLELARVLAQNNKSMTVITNMPDIIWILSAAENIRVIAIGGEFDRRICGMVGSEADRYIRMYQCDKAFTGVCGVNVAKGIISTGDLNDGNTKKTIMSCAAQNYLVMESEKFHYDDLYAFASLEEVTGIITEDDLSDEIRILLQKHDVQVL